MVTGSPAGLEHAQERFQESRVVRYDLTTPPSAEELGIDEGRSPPPSIVRARGTGATSCYCRLIGYSLARASATG